MPPPSCLSPTSPSHSWVTFASLSLSLCPVHNTKRPENMRSPNSWGEGKNLLKCLPNCLSPRASGPEPPESLEKSQKVFSDFFHVGKRLIPVLPFLVFLLEFLVFSPLQGFPFFLSVFPFFYRDFRGSVAIENPCFFGGFPCLLQEKQGKEGQGWGGQNVSYDFGGGKRTIECALQNQFWRAQKVGLVWSVPVPFKENDIA